MVSFEISNAPANPTPDPLNTTILLVLGIAGFFTVVPLLVVALSAVRDELVAQGWVSRSSWLGRMAIRSETAKTIPILQAIGLDEFAENALRNTSDALGRHARNNSQTLLGRPDIEFLKRAKDWVYRLDTPYNYKGSYYYLDMMGALEGRKKDQLSLDQIFEAWLSRLGRETLIPSFDVILAPKDGNILLCREVAKRLNKPLILCKSSGDRAWVDRAEEEKPHETDFEGLRVFYERQALKVAHSHRKYKALIIDDSCANGTQLTRAAMGFNALISLPHIREHITFEPLSHCVVLFRAIAGAASKTNFENANLALHALVAVGPKELEFLLNRTPNASETKKMFKSDTFSCASSTTIYN